MATMASKHGAVTAQEIEDLAVVGVHAAVTIRFERYSER
jgi:hypothetical protein